MAADPHPLPLDSLQAANVPWYHLHQWELDQSQALLTRRLEQLDQ